MKLILRETVPNLGEPGDVVKVKPGYGRNYLIPKGLALPANDANMRQIEVLQAEREARIAADVEATQALVDQVSGVAINVKRKVAEGDTLYGSVTAADIAAALQEEGFEVTKDQVLLDHHIKSLGIYEIPLHLRHGLDATIKLWVVAEESSDS